MRDSTAQYLLGKHNLLNGRSNSKRGAERQRIRVRIEISLNIQDSLSVQGAVTYWQ